MGRNSKIEWTQDSWNPIRAKLLGGVARIGWHCEHASPGCVNCYAETMNMAGRSAHTGTRLPYRPGHRNKVEIFVDAEMLKRPISWREPRRIFVCSMTDLFADFVSDKTIDRVFAVMALAPRHIFQVLTKRSERMREYLAHDGRKAAIEDAMFEMVGSSGAQGERRYPAPGSLVFPLPNVWLGVSVEDQPRADERIPDLLATPAAVRWISAEPLLGPVDLARVSTMRFRHAEYVAPLEGRAFGMFGDPAGSIPKLDWIVAGGESGPKARGSTGEVETWMRSIRDQCAASGVAFFGKQNFKKKPLPDDLMVREYPA